MIWYMYIALCRDKSLYTGITTDITRREWEHNNNNKRGAKSLRAKRPITIIYSESYGNQSEARIREAAIKNWKRKSKIALIGKITGITL